MLPEQNPTSSAQTKKEEGDGKRGDTLKYMRVDIIYKFVAYNSGAQRTMASIQNVGYIPGTSWISLRSSSCVPPSWCAMRVFAFSCVFQSGALCARGLILCLSPEPSFPFTGNHYLCVFTWMCVWVCNTQSVNECDHLFKNMYISIQMAEPSVVVVVDKRSLTIKLLCSIYPRSIPLLAIIKCYNYSCSPFDWVA